MSQRVDELVARLHKGSHKTQEILGGLTGDQWKMVLYEGPPAWTVRDLLAHFLSAEEALLHIMQDVTAGGLGAPEGLDYNAFNAQEQVRLAGSPPDRLLADLAVAREATIAWAGGLDEAALDCAGRHPALGVVPVETFLNAVYGHQLMHMRDLQALFRP